MGEWESASLREAALHMDRYRLAIQAEVDRRIGQGEPSSHARAEIVRRFRSFCRLASMDINVARPSLDGLGGTSSAGLELAVTKAVEVACECGPSADVADTLRALETRFRAGIRRIMQPAPERKEGRHRRRRTPNAGKRVRAAMDRIGDAYLALCLDTGKVFDANPAAESLFGVDIAQLLERPFLELISPGHRDDFRELEARLDAGEESGPMELVFARPAGDTVAVQINVASHTIGSRRLAIFTAREVLETAGSATRLESGPKRGFSQRESPPPDSRTPLRGTPA